MVENATNKHLTVVVVGKMKLIKLVMDDIMCEVPRPIFGRKFTVICVSIGNTKLGREQQIS
jgi:hypothetical protein